MWRWNPAVPVLAIVPRVSLASSIHLSGEVPYSDTASAFFHFSLSQQFPCFSDPGVSFSGLYAQLVFYLVLLG